MGRNQRPVPSPPSPPPVAGFGARLLTQLGWTPGSGLGTRGDGIAEPLAVATREEGTGLGKVPPHRERLYAGAEWWADGFAKALQRTAGASAAGPSSDDSDDDDSDDVGDAGTGGCSGGGLGLGTGPPVKEHAAPTPAPGTAGLFAACEGRRCRPAGAAKLARLAAQDARGSVVSYVNKAPPPATAPAPVVPMVPDTHAVTVVPAAGSGATVKRRKEKRSSIGRDKVDRAIRKAEKKTRKERREQKKLKKCRRRSEQASQ